MWLHYRYYENKAGWSQTFEEDLESQVKEQQEVSHYLWFLNKKVIKKSELIRMDYWGEEDFMGIDFRNEEIVYLFIMENFNQTPE